MSVLEVKQISRFLHSPAATGLLLVSASILAIILANSPWAHLYHDLLATAVKVQVGSFEIDKPLLIWVNDGLMAIFFLLIGLELKREFLQGHLVKTKHIVLPAIGALGGMLVPAAVYVVINWGDELALKGWAIPTATDIAFALGVLALLGSRVPTGLKVFLTSLAIFDDLGAIIIIALFYSHGLSIVALAVVALCLGILFALNRHHVSEKSPYIFIGFIMWMAMLKSGIHPTLAGVLLAFFIPLEHVENHKSSPLKTIEHDLQTLVNFFILPFFAFCNAGVRLLGVELNELFNSVPVGIALGLFVGKQLGIFSFSFVAVRMGIGELPKHVSWRSFYGISLLCGIGFTMSLFIGSLAFGEGSIAKPFDERVGILLGSVLSGVIGFWVLRWALDNRSDFDKKATELEAETDKNPQTPLAPEP